VLAALTIGVAAAPSLVPMLRIPGSPTATRGGQGDGASPSNTDVGPDTNGAAAREPWHAKSNGLVAAGAELNRSVIPVLGIDKITEISSSPRFMLERQR
jgi:hypothetical protein